MAGQKRDVSNVIGEILRLALAVAVSPIPNVAIILILFSPKARTNGPAFLVGWIAGLALAGILVTVLSASAGLGGLFGQDESTPRLR